MPAASPSIQARALRACRSAVVLLFALAPVCAPERAVAHEIPTDVVVQTILKPEPQHIEFLVRVPLEAMRDVNFPQSGPGYLVISQADQTLRDAAVIWIGREVRLYENGAPLEE